MKPLPPPESRSSRMWDRASDPEKVLLIRLQAIGDVAITLPSAHGLRDRYPGARIDFLTLEPTASFLRSLRCFNHVYSVPAGLKTTGLLAEALRIGRAARGRAYDVIVDLQRNWSTRLIRRLASPVAWAEFDRFAPKSASERVAETFASAGLPVLASHRLTLESGLGDAAARLLRDHGWDPRRKLVVLNPAGIWKSRNWPLDSYVSLAQRWVNVQPVQFVLLGVDRMRTKSEYLKQRIADKVLDLVGATSLEMACAVLQHATCVVSEDSGLMHMAWSSGVPLIALFGSSRHVWSAPTGPRVRVLHSGDLPCGQCMDQECRFGDVHCLTRVQPDQVLGLALELFNLFEKDMPGSSR